MQHHLDRVLRRVGLVSLAPIVANSVSKDAASLVERGRRDGPADVGVALKTVLRVLVPEVEGSVGASRAEGAVDRVEGDIVDGVDIGDVVGGRVAVAFEREVGAAHVSMILNKKK